MLMRGGGSSSLRECLYRPACNLGLGKLEDKVTKAETTPLNIWNPGASHYIMSTLKSGLPERPMHTSNRTVYLQNDVGNN